MSNHSLCRYRYREERKMRAKLAIETIKTINGQDDIGVENFIKVVKRARLRCEKPEILLDLIPMKTWTKPTGLPRLNANTTPRAQNSTIPLSDRSKMNCFKCGKIVHMSSQCQLKQGFPRAMVSNVHHR